MRYYCKVQHDNGEVGNLIMKANSRQDAHTKLTKQYKIVSVLDISENRLMENDGKMYGGGYGTLGTRSSKRYRGN